MLQVKKGAVKKGDTVRVHYIGTLEDGTVFDKTAESGPLEFIVGEGKLIPGFDDAVVGMRTGEKKTVKIPSERAYGPRIDDLEVALERANLPEDVKPEVGKKVRIGAGEGAKTDFTITEVSDESVTLDANHPLAGQDLTFEIELVDIV